MSGDALAPIGVIADYNLLEKMDAAGPGDLYRARDTRRGRTVAVRVLPADFTADQAALVASARAVQVLSHPNAITVFDAGTHDDRVYVVFEFLKGRSLRSEMAGRPVNVRRAVDMTIQIADAVADAHAAGFFHGGLSPETIVITAKGNAKIPAFDLAVQNGLSNEGGQVRLDDYASPEEARGEAPDERSDVYSAGAILYEMLTMRRPMHRGASAPSASNASVPKELDAVVLRAVSPNPDSRYQNVATFAGDLRSVGSVAEEEPHRAPASASSTTIGGVALTTVAILGVVAAILWWVMRS
ncbi:MAG TPA: serine/threonine-protein kinase [Vicinamibacterales bacterium]|nr:serine/threonine-protein kinase [Vicinamibacterales bacterium]